LSAKSLLSIVFTEGSLEMGFGAEVRRFRDHTFEKQDALVAEVVKRVAWSVIDLSAVGDPSLWKNKAPKGYVGGRFVANWKLGVGSINRETTLEIDPDGEPTLGKIVGSIPKNAAGHVYYITNSLPYAIPLENGHSSQSPLGMVTLTAINFASLFTDALKATTINGRSFGL
jgi:hypothetical protein